MLVVIVIVCFLAEEVVGTGKCKDHEFFNLERQKCQECTVCKPGQMLRRTCSETNDTLCGMINFSFLDPRKEDKHFYNTKDSLGTRVLEVEQYSSRVTRGPTIKAPYVLSEENELEWKNLAFALIGILSVLIIVTTVLVLVICYKVRYTGWFCKSVTGIDQGKTFSLITRYE